MTYTEPNRLPPRRRRRTHKKRSPPPRRQKFHFKIRWIIILVIMVFVGNYISGIDIKVRKQFEGKRWALPARVYASPLELYSGSNINPESLAKELKALGYQHSKQLYETGQYQRNKDKFIITTRAFKFWDEATSTRKVQVRFNGNIVKSITELQTKRQIPLLRLEPRLIGKLYPTHNEDRILVQLKDVPKQLIDAIIAVEDRNFYSHYGVSIRGILRAFFENVKSGELVQGGSTLTQQLVKNFYLTPERTLKRKINEAIMSVLLEWHYSKEQILEAYFNEVFLGQDGNRAIHGMGMAARFYFNRPLKDLRLPQLALLVGLIRGPTVYNPRLHSQKALDRRNMVLDIMAQENKISSEKALLAKNTPLDIIKKMSEKFPYPAFIGFVRHQLHKDYREEDLRSEGLQIFTTLNPTIQRIGERVMVRGLRKLQKKTRKARNLQGAMVVTNVENGEVLAFVNGKNSQYAGFNRPLNAIRPIGSLVKIAVYLTALERNNSYSLTTIINDKPYTWVDRNTGEVWKPRNYDKISHGRVPLYYALAHSYNLATVRLGMSLGLGKIYETLERLGVEKEFKTRYPSMLLGSISLTPLEVTQMYQTIASGGFRIPLKSIRAVLDHKGEPLKHYGLEIKKRFDEAPVYLLNYALRRAVREGTGRKVARTLPSRMVLAGKTGTSNDKRDSWFAGFGGKFLAVTWVGRDDNKPMGLSGGTGAMVVWRDFIASIRPNTSLSPAPRNIRWRKKGSKRIPYIVGGSSSNQTTAKNGLFIF
ncbi:penicillin-binding protein 1B [Candidatus Halobeggiatoa sp. HSG11]|nr:penicillin-binding protein 1B [Candidatus Halobeggiatoa sp. HSG11]